MERILVVKGVMPKSAANTLLPTFESKELARLRAELGVRRNRDKAYYEHKIKQAQRKYGAPPKRQSRLLLTIGLMLLFIKNPASLNR